MRSYKKALLFAACATGLLLAVGGCQEPDPPDPWGDIEFCACPELFDGGELDCEAEEDEGTRAGSGSEGEDSRVRCKLALSACAYYKLDKYRIIVDLGYGTVYQFPCVGEDDYVGHSPARRETENAVNISPPGPTFWIPYLAEDLFGVAYLRVSVFDTETGGWSYSGFSMYRALVSPEVTYQNTVWGNLRVQGDSAYVWHILPPERYYDHRVESNKRGWSFLGRLIEDWDPEKPIDWKPGEKEAHDALAREVSLSLPLVDGWEAHDVNLILSEGIRGWWDDDNPIESEVERLRNLPEHLRRSFTEAEYVRDALYPGYLHGDGFLEFKIRRR